MVRLRLISPATVSLVAASFLALPTVTGASGWIGSAVVPELIGAGHQVLGLARSDSSTAAITAMAAEVLRGTTRIQPQVAPG